jgi:hypothetical protein
LDDARDRLPLPGEPAGLKAETRALLEDSPEEGARVVRDANFVAGPLWEEWGETLEEGGMDRARFLEIARGYSEELRLWVVGERPWNHCVSGLAGRARRRLPAIDGAASRR